jgi:hypothetical protein
MLNKSAIRGCSSKKIIASTINGFANHENEAKSSVNAPSQPLNNASIEDISLSPLLSLPSIVNAVKNKESINKHKKAIIVILLFILNCLNFESLIRFVFIVMLPVRVSCV